MKVLFDQGTPVPLRRHLHPHVVDTAGERGWSRLKNGDLLDQAEANRYDAFITTDTNLRYQQNLSKRVIRTQVGRVASLCGSLAPVTFGVESVEKGRDPFSARSWLEDGLRGCPAIDDLAPARVV